MCQVGSSPRGRGKLNGRRIGHIRVRLIPARAGKTASVRPRRLVATAHPRAGGENTLWEDMRVAVAGSSPRGRGKLCSIILSSVMGRLIPARAGKTIRDYLGDFAAEAHPRAGGENFGPSPKALRLPGSSPRGRGKLQHRRVGHNGGRLIPARAGKTDHTRRRRANRAAHPRAGGENPSQPVYVWRTDGSSPRGRGKRGHEPPRRRRPGLIPARAGKTCRRA